MRLRLARLFWAASEWCMSAGYRIAYGMSYRAYIEADR